MILTIQNLVHPNDPNIEYQISVLQIQLGYAVVQSQLHHPLVGIIEFQLLDRIFVYPIELIVWECLKTRNPLKIL